MYLKKRHLTCAVAIAAGLAAPGQAQIGSGWTSYSPAKSIHLDADGRLNTFSWTSSKCVGTACYRSANGIEYFDLKRNNVRAEIRLQNNYTTAWRQLQGEVKVSRPTNEEATLQVFGGDGQASAFMLRSFSPNGGELRGFGNYVLMTGVYDRWVRVNIIHDGVNNRVTVYLNGANKGTRTAGGYVNHYHKYGIYGTCRVDSGHHEWRNMRHFRR